MHWAECCASIKSSNLSVKCICNTAVFSYYSKQQKLLILPLVSLVFLFFWMVLILCYFVCCCDCQRFSVRWECKYFLALMFPRLVNVKKNIYKIIWCSKSVWTSWESGTLRLRSSSEISFSSSDKNLLLKRGMIEHCRYRYIVIIVLSTLRWWDVQVIFVINILI